MSDLQSLLKQEVTGQSTNLTCRSIRIGSYKTLAKEKVYFTQKAIYIRVPYLTDSKRMITLVIPATGKKKNINMPEKNSTTQFDQRGSYTKLPRRS